ncbi:MAG: hypothetical protein M1838_003881 [Thelocarpon superellum]|nr:MAG: hypothetical protein M1838_003881 [Thelocarpon superellum]
MPFNTLTVSGAVTPTVVQTYFSHYLDRKNLHQKPTAHISYHEGLQLIRQFLLYSSHHTVEDIQAFTSQWVPSPRWVKVDVVKIPEEQSREAAVRLQGQLGHHGIDQIGGKMWWQWRREGADLKAEWIEMRSNYEQRKKTGDAGRRVMLYVHGGAYYFGSVDEHRYQMQRHARKLGARVFARMLVTMRDQGIPLPAGAILLSPWVDLTHSFPSCAADTPLDYIPEHGFLHRPSESWPPPNNDDMVELINGAIGQAADQFKGADNRDAVQGYSVDAHPDLSAMAHDGGVDAAATTADSGAPGNTVPGPNHDLSLMLDGKMVEIKDQIQMYATNQLISHPLVSPVLQPSLGGLCPLFILTGGGEKLRDEQIYLAHKAANPAKYPPGDAYLDRDPNSRETLKKWKGTDVQLQVWDDCCHVAPTLSFTRPAKYMYRSIAQFGAWALARAQQTEIDIMDDDDVSVISESSDSSEDKANDVKGKAADRSPETVGRAGDALPPFRNHMIRQRVDRNGIIYPLTPASSLPALHLPPGEIGVIKAGPVQKWMAAKSKWDQKYAREKRRVQKQRAKDILAGYEDFENDDAPPPSALAARRRRDMGREAAKGRSWGMSLWSLWGSSHDEKTIQREEKADKEPETSTATASGTNKGITKENPAPTPAPASTTERERPKALSPARSAQYGSRSRSRRRTVTDAGQTSGEDNRDGEINENTTVAELLAKKGSNKTQDPGLLSPSVIPIPASQPSTPVALGQTNGHTHTSAGGRPSAGNVAYPFKLAPTTEQQANASTLTLNSSSGIVSPPKENPSVDTTETANARASANGSISPATMSPASKRPEPERFVTATEGSGSVAIEAK